MGRQGATLRAVAVMTALAAYRLILDEAPKPLYPEYPSETPDKFTPVTDSYDFTSARGHDSHARRRQAAHHCFGAQRRDHAGMLLTRTPYNATELTSHAHSSHLGPMLHGYDNATDVILEDGYIRVVQDVRGKYGSEGDYIMNRPVHGPQNPTPVDDSTDTYDTIDWLVKNVPESNGR
jgi:hypothetical protein